MYGDQHHHKMSSRWELFDRLWRAFVTIAERVIQRGGVIAFEWPKGCRLWRITEVREFVVTHDLERVFFDGCAYGLVSRHGANTGRPIKKPWAVCTNCPTLLSKLGRSCPHQPHEHTDCAGADSKASEGYTDPLVQRIHWCFMQHVLLGSQRTQVHQGTPRGDD